MKKTLFFLAGLFSCLVAKSDNLFSPNSDIDDLALIYIGSQHRPDWTEDLFRPYVVHTYPDGKQSWMFDGFLMLDFMIYNDNGQDVSLGEYNGFPANKNDWERLLVNQLGVGTGLGCEALDRVIDGLLPVLGEPGHKHKVVLSLPVPEANVGDTWGMLDGHKINFDLMEDCIAAMQWYGNLLMEKWEAAGFKNIELDGVYWTSENFYDWKVPLVEAVNGFYHENGLHTYWIPYFGAHNIDKWKDCKFDIAYLQPGYYFNDQYEIERLERAIDDAWEFELGLEVEFGGYYVGWDKVTGAHPAYVGKDTGLFGVHPAKYQRFVDYIDKFEEYDVFTSLPVAYYSGSNAVYDFENSDDPKDKEIINRVATIINRRHVMSRWDKEPSMADIGEVSVGDHQIAYGLNGRIYLADDLGEEVSVYTADGKIVYNRASLSGERQLYGMTVSVPQGVYIVRTPSKAIKVAVR